MSPDRLRNIDPRDVPRDFSCDIFVRNETEGRMIVNGKVGIAIYTLDTRGLVRVAVMCERSTPILRGKAIDKQPRKEIDNSKRSGVGVLVLTLSTYNDSYVLIGDDLKLEIDGIGPRGVDVTLRSPKLLAVEMVEPNVDVRQLLSDRDVGK